MRTAFNRRDIAARLIAMFTSGCTEREMPASPHTRQRVAGYAPRGRDDITKTVCPEITERFRSPSNWSQRTATFDVWHFSGYILATGRARR